MSRPEARQADESAIRSGPYNRTVGRDRICHGAVRASFVCSRVRTSARDTAKANGGQVESRAENPVESLQEEPIVIDFEITGSRRAQVGPSDWSRLARGALETLAIIGCYTASGLAWAAIEGNLGSDPRRARDASAARIYAGVVSDESSSCPRAAAAIATTAGSISATPAPTRPCVWLVDGFNVLHAGLLGGRDRANWWTESKRRELLDRVDHFEDTGAELWIVFDGRHKAPEPHQAVSPRCVFAPSADAWLVERVREAADPTQMAVVTADRQLAGRARSRGAQVVSPRDFLARCPV